MAISISKNEQDAVCNYIAIFADISKRKAAEERIQYLAQHDFLTNLPNRILFRDRLKQACAHAQRNRTQVALLSLDLDRLKTINDSLGHVIGDRLLQSVARRLSSCMRKVDTVSRQPSAVSRQPSAVSRQGDDEFVLIISEIQNSNNAMQAVVKIRESLNKPYRIQGHDLTITTSIGISLYPEDGDNIDSLIINADTALHHAKELGRNSYQFFTQELNVRMLEHLVMENRLRGAIEREELSLHYQPQLEVATGKLILNFAVKAFKERLPKYYRRLAWNLTIWN